LEAAAQGITLGPRDLAVRCNLVTIRDHLMEDFTAGHITTAESTKLLAACQGGLAADFPALVAAWRFTPGVSYRNLLLYRGNGTCGVQAAEDSAAGSPLGPDLRTTPPHDLMDKPVVDQFPRGTGSRLLTEIMAKSADWLADHPVNRRRVAAGLRPATHVWLWGTGRAPAFEPFMARYGCSGTMITAVDLLRGLAALAGWKRRDVVGATGYLDTDYAAKGRAAIAEFATSDLVCVHVEAPDEASHQGDAAAKVQAIEAIDEKIVAPVAAHLAATGEHRILVCPDHPTFIATKAHSRGAVPFVMAGTGVRAGRQTAYHEASAAAAGDSVLPGWTLMWEFLGRRGDVRNS
ncbi:MAG: phosphoglycerate mutase, partial [Planctomycetes bacterium]|nr:phosphoglycerate mutase [Planctomycetota bacterium]